MSQPPEWPFAYSPDDHCEIHGYEPIPPNGNYHRICGECHHVFLTAEELVDKDAAMFRSVTGKLRRDRPENIKICPECTHDF